jgi:phenylalanyl-tRNA synthetase beta subunit
MPSQISDVEEFVRISERAEECRVKRLEDVVKLKLRTPSKLYTIRLNTEEAAEVLKRLKCEVVET